MKAHRLRGDSSSLKSTLLASFDASSLNDAVKCIWKFCRQDIGLTYHTRRNSEKRDLSDALFTDVSTALNRLDLANKLPEIYCEANDLLSIPSLEVDPVQRIEANTLSIDRLMASFGELPKVISKQVVKDSASAQKALQDNSALITLEALTPVPCNLNYPLNLILPLNQILPSLPSPALVCLV